MASFKDYLTEQEEKEQEFKTRIFRVPVDHLPQLEDKIKKANKLAAKLGTKPAVINMIERKFEKVRTSQSPDDNDQDVMDALRGEKFREYQYLTVTGEIPILAGGWSFAGKIEPHEAGNIVKSAPGHKIPKRFNDTDPCACEHCNKSRRRSATFVVKKGRKYTQVGRQCLKDFMGHDHPEKFADQAEWIYDIEKELRDYENDSYGGRWEPSWSTADSLAAAHSAIKRDGFVPKSAGHGMPTSGTMYRHFDPPRGQEAKYHVPLVITDDDRKAAKETIDWVKEKSKTDKSEFITNLSKFVSVEANHPKYFGYLAAAAMMYQKEQGNLAAKKKMSDGIKSEAIGKEGDKVKLEAEVIGAFKYQRQSYHYYDSGVSQILTMKDPQGRLIKMFTANLDIKKGDKVNISGKIGKAEEEKYETSPFKGKIVTMMAPRARIEVKEEPIAPGSPEQFANIKSIQGKPIPPGVTKIEVVHALSDQWNTTLHIETKDLPKGFERKFSNKDIQWN